MQKRMLGDAENSPRFFGRFTWKDLLRLGLPLGVVLWMVGLSELSVVAIGMILVGGIVGVVWYRWRPFGDPVEVHLYHLVRWCILRVIRV